MLSFVLEIMAPKGAEASNKHGIITSFVCWYLLDDIILWMTLSFWWCYPLFWKSGHWRGQKPKINTGLYKDFYLMISSLGWRYTLNVIPFLETTAPKGAAASIEASNKHWIIQCFHVDRTIVYTWVVPCQ